jgi:hypothetical protein
MTVAVGSRVAPGFGLELLEDPLHVICHDHILAGVWPRSLGSARATLVAHAPDGAEPPLVTAS